MHCPRAGRRKAFTFLEIMFVVVIIGILLALVAPGISGKTIATRKTATLHAIASLSAAIKTFHMDTGIYPEKLEELRAVTRADLPGFNGPYVEDGVMPKDGWGRDFEYRFPGDHPPFAFDVWSAGPDGKPGSGDEIGNWMKGQ